MPQALAHSLRAKAAVILALASFFALSLRVFFVQSGFHAPSNTIDFSKSTNLKAIYDAGIRLWRNYPGSTDGVTVTNLKKVGIILPDSKAFEMSLQIGSFDILAGNQVAGASLIGEPTSMSSAAEQTHRICEALGISTDRLDEVAATLRRMGDQSPYANWEAHIKKGDMRVQVMLQPILGLFRTGGKVYVTIEFGKPGAPMKFLKEPVQPPSGYEGVSMDPPERGSRRATPLPPKAQAIIKELDATNAREEAAKARAKTAPSPSNPAPDAASPPPVTQTQVPPSSSAASPSSSP